MFEHPNIRRDDGSIDIDFYRQAGLTERRLVMIDFFRGLGRFGRPLVAVLLGVATLAMAPPRDGVNGRAPIAATAKPYGVCLAPPAASDQLYAMNAAR